MRTTATPLPTTCRVAVAFFVAAVFAALPGPAAAQRFSFEQSVDVVPGTTLDIATERGRIDVSVGESTRVQVIGTVTVRAGWDVPPDAVTIARRVADHPPVEDETGIIRLRPPMTATERRAVTVSYDVTVPRRTRVVVNSDSGAVTIRDVGGPVTVSTQSSTIALNQLGANADIKTGSGAVRREIDEEVDIPRLDC